MWNGTIFVDLDWPLNASSLLSASAELLVCRATWFSVTTPCGKREDLGIKFPFHGAELRSFCVHYILRYTQTIWRRITKFGMKTCRERGMSCGHPTGILAWEGRRMFGDPPPKCIQEPFMVGIRDGRPQRGPLAVHCFCVCRRSALLGDLTGVSTTMELEFLCVMSYPNSVSTCQVIG